MRKLQRYSGFKFALLKVQFILFLIGGLGPVFAENQGASPLRKAAHLFEFEGDFESAKKILQKIVEENQSKDVNQALLMLGKISEITGDSKSAIYFYRALQQRPQQNAATDYWVAERLAIIDPLPTSLVLSLHNLPSPIRTVLSQGFVALQDGSIWQTEDGDLQAIPVRIPSEYQPWAVDRGILWYGDLMRNRVGFLNLSGKGGERSFALDSPIQSHFALSGAGIVISTQKFLYYFKDGRQVWKRESSWRDCAIQGVFSLTRDLVLNCPDNALHLVSLAQGTRTTTLALLDPVGHVLLAPLGILAFTEESAVFYQPHRDNTPVWRTTLGNIKSAVISGVQVFVQSGDGQLNILDINNGAIRHTITHDPGELYSAPPGIVTISGNGRLQMLDVRGQTLWDYYSGRRPAWPPWIGDRSLALPISDQSLVFLNRRFHGLQKHVLELAAERARALFSTGQFHLLRPLLDSILFMEPGNTRAWELQARLIALHSKNSDSLQQAWHMALRGASGSRQRELLIPFAQVHQAQWAVQMPGRPGTGFPVILADDRSLLRIDPFGRVVQFYDLHNGGLRWQSPTGRISSSFLHTRQGRWLMLADGLQVGLFDLHTKGSLLATRELPGRPFAMQADSLQLLVSTWNGYVQAFNLPRMELAWSRKPFSTGAHLAMEGETLNLLALTGEMQRMDLRTGAPYMRTQIEIGTASQLLQVDTSLIAVGQEGQVVMLRSPDLSVRWRINLDHQCYSSTLFFNHHRPLLIVGLANQELRALDLRDGRTVWSFHGGGSALVRPTIIQNRIIIDHGKKLHLLDPSNGILRESLPLPEGSGPPASNRNFIFSATKDGLLLAYYMPQTP